MKKAIYLLPICAYLTTAAIMGCSATKAEPPAVPPVEKSIQSTIEIKEPEEKAGQSRPSANSYYHYLASQLQEGRGDIEAAISSLKAAAAADPGALRLYRELAVLYLRKNEPQAALSVVEKQLADHPENVDLLLMKASIAQSLDPETDVTPIYERILSLDPQQKRIYKVLGKAYLDSGSLERAEQVFSQMVRRFPDAYVGYFYLGRIHARKGDTEKAKQAFEKTVELAPALNQPRWELIELHKAAGDTEAIIALYEEILGQNPENVAAALELSLAYYRKGQSEKAAAILSELALRSLEDRSVVRTVMKRLVLEKRYEDALRVLETMTAAEPLDPALQYAAGVVYYELDRFEAAEKALKKIGPNSDFYENAAVHRAIMAYQADDTQRAISILETAMEEARGEARVELIPYLSSFYQERGALGKAEDLLREGVSTAPENTELRFELGALLDERGEHAAAIEQMKRVLDIDPDHADALNYLGYTYADKGVHLEKAESYIRRALNQKPDNGYILDSMGWLYYKTGRPEKALVYIEKAARLIPEDPIVREHLGDVYKRLGKREEALEAYRKALSLEPENPASIEAKIEALRKNGS